MTCKCRDTETRRCRTEYSWSRDFSYLLHRVPPVHEAVAESIALDGPDAVDEAIAAHEAWRAEQVAIQAALAGRRCGCGAPATEAIEVAGTLRFYCYPCS